MLPMTVTSVLNLSATTVANTSVAVPANATNGPTDRRVLRMVNRGPNVLYMRFDTSANNVSGVYMPVDESFIVAIGSESTIYALPVSGPAVLNVTMGYVRY